MLSSYTVLQSLRRVFNEGFSVRDIAEPLASFDHSMPVRDADRVMKERSYQVVGIRKDGDIVGYMEASESASGTCGDLVLPFDDSNVIADSSTLAQLVIALDETPRLFVSLIGRVGGIVTRTDLQKPPVRMWLFGMVSLVEMRVTRLIAQNCPAESWTEYLSESRLEKASAFFQERSRVNQSIGLLDCTQFADKGRIVARNERLRALTSFESRRQTEKLFRDLERLRNNLAHSQDIITNDWGVIVQLSENLDRVLTGPPGIAEQDAG